MLTSYYGTLSQKYDFKVSLSYPPNKDVRTKMRTYGENNRQTHHISARAMKQIITDRFWYMSRLHKKAKDLGEDDEVVIDSVSEAYAKRNRCNSRTQLVK